MGRDWASYSKRVPDLSIQDGKKRFGGFPIVLMRMQPVTGFFEEVWQFLIPSVFAGLSTSKDWSCYGQLTSKKLEQFSR